MRVAVTGTPGVGKTTAVERLDTDLEVVHLNEVVREHGFAAGEDPDRGSLVADLDAVGGWLDGRDDLLVESHLAHRFPADRVVVLRCHPAELVSRLTERGEPEAKARENAESEALDVVLSEAVERHGRETVFEIDATDRSPGAVAGEIRAVIDGDRDPSAGAVDFLEWL